MTHWDFFPVMFSIKPLRLTQNSCIYAGIELDPGGHCLTNSGQLKEGSFIYWPTLAELTFL